MRIQSKECENSLAAALRSGALSCSSGKLMGQVTRRGGVVVVVPFG